MTLNEFLIQKKQEYAKYLRKQDIMKSQEYQNTKRKDELLKNRMKDFEEKISISMEGYSFDCEYQKMISLLRFVFPNIPMDRYTFRSNILSTGEEALMYEEIESSKKEKVVCDIDEDIEKWERLAAYLLFMEASEKQSVIENTKKAIKTLIHSFSENPPKYIPKDNFEEKNNNSDVSKKRKTHTNKRELLDQLYKNIFINRSDEGLAYEEISGLTPYINANEKEFVSFLLHLDPADENLMYLTKQRIIDQLIEQDYSELDEIEKTEKANLNFKQIVDMLQEDGVLTDIENLRRIYKGKKDSLLSSIEYRKKGSQYYPAAKQDLWGKESVFDELNAAEVDFLNYLYRLYYSYREKYRDSNQKDKFDISNFKNSKKWDILNQEERETLAEYILKLCDEGRCILKYVREEDICAERRKKYSFEDYIFGRHYGYAEHEPTCENRNIECVDDSSSILDECDPEEYELPFGKWISKNSDDLNDVLEEANEIVYSLVAEIKEYPYYDTYKRAERVLQLCQKSSDLINLENPDMKALYLTLEAKIKEADSICQKLIECSKKERKLQIKDDV